MFRTRNCPLLTVAAAIGLLASSVQSPLLAGEAGPTEVVAEKPKPGTPTPPAPKKEKPKPTLDGARTAIAKGDYAGGLEAIEAFLPKAKPDVAHSARLLRLQALLETGEYQKAIDEAAALADKAPRDPDVLTALAEGLIVTGQYDDARARLGAALRARPEHLRTRVLTLELAQITGDRQAMAQQVSYFFDLYAKGKAKTAEALTATARAVQDEDAQDEDAHGAWRAYQEAQQADKSYVPAYIEAGFLCLEKYAWSFARDNFTKVLKANPQHAVAHAGLAAVLLANSRYGQALHEIQAALKTNSRLPLALHLKASLFAAEQKHDASLAAIQAALKVNSRNPRTLSLLAAHHEAVVNATEREKAIQQVLAINPRFADVYIELCLASQRLRRAPAAIAWARKAIELRPGYWHGYHLAGMNLIRSGEEKEGYQLLERAFQLNRFNIWASSTSGRTRSSGLTSSCCSSPCTSG